VKYIKIKKDLYPSICVTVILRNNICLYNSRTSSR